MPRPGPRPYECVRRAWHSDRHQPMRGSVIQQIFRVVHESHTLGTKKNKEWQEKLPIVVLKAEEIMYSKANSEAEYMDFQTIWERVNDAINTIIRRDESLETGDLLPPCVEAALNLGCVPVRASRSQRHTNPRSYLSPKTDETICSSSKIANNNPVNNRNQHLPPRSENRPNLSNHSRPVIMNPPRVVTEQTRTNTTQNTTSVYPLYYGTNLPIRPEMPQFPFQIPRNSNPIIVGTPVFSSTIDPPRLGCFKPVISHEKTDFTDNIGKTPEPCFDLSLRLGSFKDSVDDMNNIELRNSRDSSSPKRKKEFSFFPVETTTMNDPSGFGTSRWGFEDDEGQNVGIADRKRKVPFDINLEDELIFSQSQIRSDQFSCRKRPGL